MKRKMRFMLTGMLLVMLLILIGIQPASAATRLNKSRLTLEVGKTYLLKVKGTKATVRWSSSDKKVVTVSKKGKLTAKKEGTATITAKVSGKKLKCKVTVVQKESADDISAYIEKLRKKNGWAVAYEVTKNAQDYLSNNKTREGWYEIKPEKKGGKGSFQWIQCDGKRITDDRPVVTVTSKIAVAFGRGYEDCPWCFFGKGVVLERCETEGCE